MKILIYSMCFALSTASWGGVMKSNGEKLKEFYQKLDKNNLQLVYEFYSPNVEFTDPIGSMKGTDNVKAYYANMYENVKEIKFDFKDVVESGNTVVAVWVMTLKTDKLNDGKSFTVEGNSVLHFDLTGKALYHRDYFDMGEFIYERVPVLSFIIKKIKSRMSLGH